jgi:hypothetical protein
LRDAIHTRGDQKSYALHHHLRPSIPALWLFQPVLDDPAGYIAGAGADNRIFLGAFLELLLMIAKPEFLWELSLGIYLTVKGFRPSPILSLHSERPVPQPA